MKISEQKLQWKEAIDGYQYKIEFPDDIKGDARLIFETLIERIGTYIFQVLVRKGLNKEDKIVQLNEFYPNGKGLDEKNGENMKEGRGTTVLDYLIKKAIAEGAKAMCAFTGKTSMQSFLLKHDFEEVTKYRYIKIL